MLFSPASLSVLRALFFELCPTTSAGQRCCRRAAPAATATRQLPILPWPPSPPTPQLQQQAPPIDNEKRRRPKRQHTGGLLCSSGHSAAAATLQQRPLSDGRHRCAAWAGMGKLARDRNSLLCALGGHEGILRQQVAATPAASAVSAIKIRTGGVLPASCQRWLAQCLRARESF